MVDRKRWRDKRLATWLAGFYSTPTNRVSYQRVLRWVKLCGEHNLERIVYELHVHRIAPTPDVPELRLAAMDAAERERGK